MLKSNSNLDTVLTKKQQQTVFGGIDANTVGPPENDALGDAISDFYDWLFGC